MNKLDKIFQNKMGIRLDLGCSDHPQKGFVGMDMRAVKGVDIVHNVQDFPWPIPDNICLQVLMSHLWEHIEPKYRMQVMEELWRIMKPDGQLLISAPYYLSFGAYQDPTHYPCPNEATFTYFDPRYPMYQVYKPSPWRLVSNNYMLNGNLEVLMEADKTPKVAEVVPQVVAPDVKAIHEANKEWEKKNYTTPQVIKGCNDE